MFITLPTVQTDSPVRLRNVPSKCTSRPDKSTTPPYVLDSKGRLKAPSSSRVSDH